MVILPEQATLMTSLIEQTSVTQKYWSELWDPMSETSKICGTVIIPSFKTALWQDYCEQGARKQLTACAVSG